MRRETPCSFVGTSVSLKDSVPGNTVWHIFVEGNLDQLSTSCPPLNLYGLVFPKKQITATASDVPEGINTGCLSGCDNMNNSFPNVYVKPREQPLPQGQIWLLNSLVSTAVIV